MTDEERIARFRTAFARTFPGKQPPTDAVLRDVFASVDAAPPMTDTQRRRIGHLFFGDGAARAEARS